MSNTLVELGSRSEQDSIEAARREALRRLSQNATGAGLTFGEYAERISAIERAATAAELETAVVGEQAIEVHPGRRGSWLVSILGGSEQRGRWRLGRRLRIVAVLGGAKLDLGNAQPEAPESVISAFAFLGGVDLIAPPGVPIELVGISLLGGKADKRPSAAPLPGAPRIRVRALAVLGGVAVKPRRRSLIDVVRARRRRASISETPTEGETSSAARG